MGLFDSVSNLFGGGGQKGYGDMQGQIQNGINSINQNYGQGRDALNPYQQAGTNALGNYQNWAQNMQNPTDYYNNIMKNYNMSPAAQMNAQYGQKAMNQAAAAGGMVGSPSQQEQIGRFMNNLVNTDQQQYFNNINGINNQYGAAQGNLMGQGYGAANGINNSYMGQGNALAGLYNNMGQAQLQQQMAQANGINNMIGMGVNGFLGSGMGKEFSDWWGS